MEELKVLITDAIESIDQTTEIFYQQKMDEGYKQLEITLAVLTKAIDTLFQYKAAGNPIEMDEQQLTGVLSEALKAMQERDTVLLSDIMQYELKESLGNIVSSL